MYTTKPLSLYRNTPEAISLPPEGPNSGYLVLQDDESTTTCCFGLCKDPSIKHLPFPQNKRLSIEYLVPSGDGGYHTFDEVYLIPIIDEVYLIPIINQPLSSNRYYAIKADGRHKGEAYASSLEQDKVTCCFCIPCIQDVKPRPFDPDDIYQQFEFFVTKTCLNSNKFLAKSVAPDGHPPNFFRRDGWEMKAKSLKKSTLGEAQGIDSYLRAHLPDFYFPSYQACSKSLVVGKWYCPFIFIKDGREENQIKNNVFYEMTLEQRWERIFAADNTYDQEKVVTVDALVPTEMVKIAAQPAVQEESNEDRGVVWFKAIEDEIGTEERVGLSSLIVERMIWEEERFGWVNETKKHVKVVKEFNYEGIIGWGSFGCYVLVESFVLKRNDGSIVLTYDFRHTHHQLRSKWD